MCNFQHFFYSCNNSIFVVHKISNDGRYISVCMTCATCGKLCVLNVNSDNKDRFGFFVDTGLALVGKDAEWVRGLTYKEIWERAETGPVKLCCTENAESKWSDDKIFMKMKSPDLPRAEQLNAI